MKNFDDFIKYLDDNKIYLEIFEKAKTGNEFKQENMFMAFIHLLREYHDWLNR